MCKLFLMPSVLLAQILFNAVPAFGSNVLVQGNGEFVSTKVNVPLCYMQTSKGRTVDLSKTCGFVSPSICADSLGTPERDAVLSEFCMENEKCELTGTCDQMPQPINAPPPGVPAGMKSPSEVVNDSSVYAVVQRLNVGIPVAFRL